METCKASLGDQRVCVCLYGFYVYDGNSTCEIYHLTRSANKQIEVKPRRGLTFVLHIHMKNTQKHQIDHMKRLLNIGTQYVLMYIHVSHRYKYTSSSKCAICIVGTYALKSVICNSKCKNKYDQIFG